MSIPGHDKTSSRVVLENGGAACSKVMDNILLLREKGSRVIARLVVQSRGRRILPHSEEKPKNRAGSHNEVGRKTQNSSGRGHFWPNLNGLQEKFSLMAFLYFRAMLAALSSSEKPKNHTRLCGQRSLSFVALLKKFLCSVTRRRKKDDDRKRMKKRVGKKLDNSEVKQQKR